MKIITSTSTEWLFVHWIQIELEFGNASTWGEGQTGEPGEKLPGAEKRLKNELNPHIKLSSKSNPGPING